MSKLLIQNYLAELARLRQVSGSQRESVVREAFKDLLKSWGRAEDRFESRRRARSVCRIRKHLGIAGQG